ncbi:MAG: hypothetical protein JNL98_17265 [Bryobacterales bacterium]|nr:hypothetical protein [Bryobacterales bacterium]
MQKIVTQRFGATAGDGSWVVLGDLNDFLDGSEGIGAVAKWDQAENVLDRADHDERWTHYFEGEDEYRQLDYLMVSRSLAGASAATPRIIRKGLSTKATRFTGKRFPGVTAKIAASDHCPLVFDLTL